MARRPELEVFAREHGLKIGSIEDLIRYRLDTEHTVERVDEREIDTEYGPFRLLTYRDRIEPRPAFRAGARRRRMPASRPWCACTCRTRWPTCCTGAAPISGRPWRRAGARSPREGRGALVLLWRPARRRQRCWRRLRQQPDRSRPEGQALAEWRRNGAGAQILADLGLGKLRVLGTPRARSAWPALGWKWWSMSS